MPMTEPLSDEPTKSKSQVLDVVYNGITNETIQKSYGKVLDIIAEESGIAQNELNDGTDFASIGVDSLLSLIMTSRLREETNFYTGSGFSLFDEFRTLGDLKSGFLDFMGVPISAEVPTPSTTNSASVTLDTTLSEPLAAKTILPISELPQETSETLLLKPQDL